MVNTQYRVLIIQSFQFVCLHFYMHRKSNKEMICFQRIYNKAVAKAESKRGISSFYGIQTSAFNDSAWLDVSLLFLCIVKFLHTSLKVKCKMLPCYNLFSIAHAQAQFMQQYVAARRLFLCAKETQGTFQRITSCAKTYKSRRHQSIVSIYIILNHR